MPAHTQQSGRPPAPRDRTRAPGYRRWLRVLLRVTVSAGLIAWLLERVELDGIARALQGARWEGVALSTVLFVGLRVPLAAFRWLVILRGDGVAVPLRHLLSWTAMSGFFSLFLPGSLGGDGARIFWIEQYGERRGRGAATVVMERVVGFVALVGLSAVAMLLSHRVITDPRLYVTLGSGAVVGLAVIGGLFHPRLYRVAVRLLERLRLPRLARLIEEGFATLRALARQRRVLAGAVVLSLAFQTVHIGCVYLISRSLGLSAPLGFYFLAVPVVSLVSVMPVSINGIGVREGAFVLVFSMVGIAEAQALAVSLLSTMQVFALGLVGGLAYAAGPWLLPTPAADRG